MHYIIKVNNIPFNYFISMDIYNVGDWFQFVTFDGHCFPSKIIAKVDFKIDENIVYKYKLG